MRRPLPALLVAAVASSSFSACAREEPVEPPPPGTPRLVVLIAVDQMRADVLERFDRFWEGGFRHLLDRSAYWVDASHDHALTQTAPGHASLATGCFPSRHGIVSNNWIDRESGESIYAGENDEDSESPERLLCEGLGDWLKARYPAAKVVSVATKDRTALMLGGLAADAAYFYDGEDGSFETASYYADDEPEWVDDFNDERRLDRHFGRAWEPLPVGEAALMEVGVEAFDLGPLEPDFPITFGGLTPVPGSGFYEEVAYSPWIDEHTAAFAEALVGAEALGGDEIPDLLAIGFSGIDYIGHRYGPDSPQMLDALRRLDRALGELFEFLDRRVGLDQVLLALSSDHGAAPLPELMALRGQPGQRASDDDVLCIQGVYARLQGRFGDGAWLEPGPFVSERARERGVAAEVEQATAELLEACDGVREVWTRSELTDPATLADPVGRLFAHSYHPERSPDFLVLRDEFFLSYRGAATSHGTAWDYDRRVPLMIAGPGVESGPRGEAVRSVDLAPTLAWRMGAAPTGEIDGVVLPLGR